MIRLCIALAAAALLVAPVSALERAGSTVEISQQGEELSADVTQELGSNRAELRQAGLDNEASLRQALGEALLRQEGEDNRARLVQAGSATGSFADGLQFGMSNDLNIVQNGDLNSALVAQFGNNNDMTVVQVGDANTLSLEQTGDDLKISVTQMGGASATVFQSGRGP